jgi:hypothetical protein
MNKKFFALSAAALMLTASIGSLTAFAKDGGENEGNKMMKMSPSFMMGHGDDEKGKATAEESVSINASGDFRVTGVMVNSVNVGANSMNVTFYGFTRDVNVSGAVITGSANLLAQVVAGDKVSAVGNWNKTTHVLTIKEVRDVTSHAQNGNGDTNQRINQLLEMVRQLQAQLEALKSGSH